MCKNLKEHYVFEKDYLWNPATCSCKNGKYVRGVTDNSVITCDEIIDRTKSILTKTVPTKGNLENSVFYLPFYQLPSRNW